MIKISVKSDAQAKQITLLVNELELEKLSQTSFNQAEQAVQQIVNQIGQELTVALLQAAQPPPLLSGRQKVL